MPARKDIKKILIIGAGPIVIGQACEFDYSGTQACKALKEEGYEVVLLNSNPATIMTDPEMASRTYIEPVTPDIVEKIIERERPDAILPTIGGQTGLNTAIAAAKNGVFEKYNVEMIGASVEAIEKAEDRENFRAAMKKIGLRVPESGFAHSMDEAVKTAEEIGFPVIIRPSYTLGGTGGGVAYNPEELEIVAKSGLDASMINQIMIEESVLGWKEYELEVVRDKKDNVVIICSIENIDAMGVHTGDSITVAPAQTLTDKEYQMLRDASIAIIREIGVDTGGSNVQFAINPENGDMIVVEMNPRVSRSSALASKATGYPIAKIAAKLAVGFTMDELKNDITGETTAAFEPTIDYVVIKIPRWTFEKFPETEDVLTTTMKSVGETMSIGRTFREALQKALRSLETGRFGLGCDGNDIDVSSYEEIMHRLVTPNSQRLFYIRYAFQNGMSIEDIHDATSIDPWFLNQIKQIVDFEKKLLDNKEPITKELLYEAKKNGFSDIQLSNILGKSLEFIENFRKSNEIYPVFKLVDTCAGEFEASTPYFYSTYEQIDESRINNCKKIMILGGGPNRIGQGIEFDYCCVHASFALKEEGIESIMVNSNPETVSTDYDTSDKLYFEPLTKEDVLHIAGVEKPDGVIVQFGGQTPLNLAVELEKAGINIIGTSPSSINRAEDREEFQAMLRKLGLKQPDNGIAFSQNEAVKIAENLGYPVLVRPSYVLGGRAMKIVFDKKELEEFSKYGFEVSGGHPVLIDKFLKGAVEIDVDALSDGKKTIIGGIMQHIEEAGIHSGDSACVLPPYSLSENIISRICEATRAMAAELEVTGLMNVQYAVKDEELYVIEVNPRASRTIPFVSKVTSVPLAKMAVKIMLGKTIDELGLEDYSVPAHFAVKEVVFPFSRFPEVDLLLGPEMKSTGEVMGISHELGHAIAKSIYATGQKLPESGNVFLSVKDEDKEAAGEVAKQLVSMGFSLMATRGTSAFLEKIGIKNKMVRKVSVGRPHVIDEIKNNSISLIINTPSGSSLTEKDGYKIRRAALNFGIPYTTTMEGARAYCLAIEALKSNDSDVKSIQEYY
ncbi:MAG: carbamoyl phosphate synthase large subunit [Deltaproteobacteria bacterium]|nr:MAG: carbamoyl phosphate synthase large subunit [Deltaproteobacteria bacterium]PIE74550.1 MAG: carbamoyl phosphate synthase large subunit [Deltaproteobacteria bacterium]